MNQLLIGTTNLAKFNDYYNLLKNYDLEIVSLHDYKIEEPKETGKDFEENAILKAKYYFNKTGIPTLADHSGFEVDALNGEPGAKSHTWAGKKSTDEELIKKVYKELKKAKASNSKCRMRVVVAVCSPFGIVTAAGVVEGVVGEKPSENRTPGYPFKSVMYLPNYGKYFSDLSEQESDILNHRKAALEKIRDILEELSK